MCHRYLWHTKCKTDQNPKERKNNRFISKEFYHLFNYCMSVLCYNKYQYNLSTSYVSKFGIINEYNIDSDFYFDSFRTTDYLFFTVLYEQIN